jgi:hypothetical protein
MFGNLVACVVVFCRLCVLCCFICILFLGLVLVIYWFIARSVGLLGVLWLFFIFAL